MVGPNATFLRYISQVLPSLAETGVLLRTARRPVSRGHAPRAEPAEAAEIKGRPVMAEVLAAAVRDRQRVPDEPLEIEVERETLRARPGDRASPPGTGPAASGRPHNLARPLFDIEIVHALADQVGRADRRRPARRGEPARRGRPAPRSAGSCASEPGGPGRAGLAVAGAHPAAAAGRPVRLRRTGSPPPRRGSPRPSGRCCAASRGRLDAGRRAAAGRGGRAARRGRPRRRGPRGTRQRRRGSEYAEGVLEIAPGSRSIDVEDEAEGGEILGVTDLLDADRLAERQEDGDRLTTAAAGRRRPHAGRSGTSSWTRRRSCRRWPGGC